MPVVPDVYMIVAGSEAFGGHGAAGLASPIDMNSAHVYTLTPCHKTQLLDLRSQALQRRTGNTWLQLQLHHI